MTKDSWKVRRRIVIGLLVWAVAMCSYIVLKGADTRLAETAFTGCIALIVSLVGSYVFGAVWDDNNVRKSSDANQPALPPSGVHQEPDRLA